VLDGVVIQVRDTLVDLVEEVQVDVGAVMQWLAQQVKEILAVLDMTMEVSQLEVVVVANHQQELELDINKVVMAVMGI
jgi:hypothetical protein